MSSGFSPTSCNAAMTSSRRSAGVGLRVQEVQRLGDQPLDLVARD